MHLNSPFFDLAQHLSSYSLKPYPDGSARIHHGFDHVIRAGLFGSAAYNLIVLCKLHGSAQLSFTEQMIECKLVQIALLLHDSGRLGEGPDLWDEDSALTIYHVLNSQFQVSRDLVIRVAEAMANKDWKPGKKYSRLQANGFASQFKKIDREAPLAPESERLRLAIQFGDCIDIYRLCLGPKFDWSYIDLYNQCNHPQTKRVIEHLIPECFELITRTVTEKTKSLRQIQNEVNTTNTPLLQALYESQQALTLEQLSLSQDPITNNFHGMNLLFRAVENPSAPFNRDSSRKTKQYTPGFTSAMQEARKINRRPWIPTHARTLEKRLNKHGNTARSACLLGPGSAVFRGVGGGIILNKDHLIAAYSKNSCTGSGPKKNYQTQPRGVPEQINPGLEESREKMRSGLMISESLDMITHSEILVDIYRYDCILFCVDPIQSDSQSPARRFLEAINLRDAYRKESNHISLLPIYEFSGRTGMCRVKHITDDLVIKAFEEIFIEDSSNTLLNPKHVNDLKLMIRAMENTDYTIAFNRLYGESLLLNHDEALRNKILANISTLNSRTDEILDKIALNTATGLVFNPYNGLHTLMRMKIGIERGAPYLTFPRFLSDALMIHFYRFARDKVEEYTMDVFLALAEHRPFHETMMDIISGAPVRHFDDYLRFIKILAPNEPANETVLRLKEMMEHTILERYCFDDLHHRKIAIYRTPDELMFGMTPLTFGKHYTAELHQKIKEMIYPETHTSPPPVFNEYVRNYRPKVNVRHKRIDSELFLLQRHSNFFNCALPMAENSLTSALLLLFRKNTAGAFVMECLRNLIKLSKPPSVHYGAMLKEIFIDLVARNVKLEVLSKEHGFIPYIQMKYLVYTLSRLDHQLDDSIIEISTQLITRIAKLFIQSKEEDLGRGSRKYLKTPFTDILPELGCFAVDEDYTEIMHEKILEKMSSQWPQVVAKIYENLEAENQASLGLNRIKRVKH